MISTNELTIKKRYYIKKQELLTDPNTCPENREFFKRYLDHQEYKLKRIIGLPDLDKGNILTLEKYLGYFKNINDWFKNQPLQKITKEDFKKVYDDLEDGKIKSRYGKPYKDKISYYNKIFRSKPFEMLGKTDIVREVMEFNTPRQKEEVRFITEEDFRLLVDSAIKVEHKALLWLAFDVGENINSLLKLTQRDFYLEQNEDLKEEEYRINLRREILKRTRRPRAETTNYQETTKYLKRVLATKKSGEVVFNVAYDTANAMLKRAGLVSGVKTQPKNQDITWKDLRSGMACDLLRKGWNRDEVNSRLGHVPSSSEIDKYINFLALDRKATKKKLQINNVENLKKEIDDSKIREKSLRLELDEMKKVMKAMDLRQKYMMSKKN